VKFPIPRDPPEGGTPYYKGWVILEKKFPIPRDPPEGGTPIYRCSQLLRSDCFQFLGIPPKGELDPGATGLAAPELFPIPRDPPEGGTLPLLNPSRARNARPICEGVGRRGQKRAWERGVRGLKALWRKASSGSTKESAFAGFGEALAKALIPFLCAFENIKY